MRGQLTRAEMEEALAPAWVQAVPSRCVEGFGLVAAVAMMRGTAVIASRAGGLAEVVEDGYAGFLVNPGDQDALAAALLLLLQNRDAAEAFGTAARQRALSLFSQETCAEAFLGLYRAITEKRS